MIGPTLNGILSRESNLGNLFRTSQRLEVDEKALNSAKWQHFIRIC